MISRTKNIDCIEGMKMYPDEFFDLAIVDHPCGKDFPAPDKEYFDELFRVSKNQIIWGANYFIEKIPINSKCWLVWDKCNDDMGYADVGLAWTSFDNLSRLYTVYWGSEQRIHTTQKPVKLYEWILKNFAKKGDMILDTHLGSGSSRIAAQRMGFDFVGFELDRNSFEDQEVRFNTQIEA
jgi:site-specific DNA-methyltransferase (adenine-specific)